MPKRREGFTKLYPVLIGMEKELAAELKKMRIENELTLKEVAEYLQKSTSTVNRIEDGLFPLVMQEFTELCIVYGKNPIEVYTDVYYRFKSRIEKASIGQKLG